MGADTQVRPYKNVLGTDIVWKGGNLQEKRVETGKANFDFTIIALIF
jgi:hypothetical protein